MNLIKFGHNKTTIYFKGFDVNTSQGVFKDPLVIARLLTYEEVKRVDRCISSRNQYTSVLVEDDVFRSCFIGIVGVDDQFDIDRTIEVIDAGIISAFADIIVSLSLEYITNFDESFEKKKNEIEWFEQIKVVLCKYLNTSYIEISEWPVDEIVSKYAVLASVFPDVPLKQSANENA